MRVAKPPADAFTDGQYVRVVNARLVVNDRGFWLGDV